MNFLVLFTLLLYRWRELWNRAELGFWSQTSRFKSGLLFINYVSVGICSNTFTVCMPHLYKRGCIIDLTDIVKLWHLVLSKQWFVSHSFIPLRLMTNLPSISVSQCDAGLCLRASCYNESQFSFVTWYVLIVEDNTTRKLKVRKISLNEVIE